MSIKGNINYMLYKILPQNTYLKIAYRNYHKKSLNINNPKLFSEKLFLSKVINGRGNVEFIRRCYDKYTAREYVKNIIGEKYLTQIYGLWTDARNIDFSKLPSKCIFKITQSSGYNVICLDLEKENKEAIRQKLDKWQKNQNDKKFTEKVYKFENYYFDQNCRIMCEELLEFNQSIPEDIRIYCFSGKAQFITVDYGSVSKDGVKLRNYYRNVYDVRGNFIDAKFGHENNPDFPFPDLPNLDEMVWVAEKLAKPFPFVRVDLYNVDGRIVFGELTWIPQGASGFIYPESFDRELGEKFILEGKL